MADVLGFCRVFGIILNFLTIKHMNGSLEVPILSDQTDKYHWKSDQMFTGKWMKWRKWQPETILLSNSQLYTISSSKENVFTFHHSCHVGAPTCLGPVHTMCFNPLSCCLRFMTTLFILFLNKHDFYYIYIPQKPTDTWNDIKWHVAHLPHPVETPD